LTRFKTSCRRRAACLENGTKIPNRWKKLTPWVRDIHEEQIVTELVKKFPAFYGTQRFVTMFTIAYHWFLS
jgi:hypothetical protein